MRPRPPLPVLLSIVVAAVVLAGACSAVSPGNVGRTATTSPSTTSATATTSAPAIETVEVAPVPDPLAGEVFVVGDSLTEGAEPWLDDAFAARGWELVGVDARVGRSVPEGLAVLRRRARSLPPTVLVALGTNNLGASDADIDGWLSTARRLVGAERQLLWVNVRAGGSPGREERAAEIDAALAAAGRRWRVHVLDWNGWSRRNGIETKVDGIHYEDAVYSLLARFYAAALPRATAP